MKVNVGESNINTFYSAVIKYSIGQLTNYKISNAGIENEGASGFGFKK